MVISKAKLVTLYMTLYMTLMYKFDITVTTK